MSLYVDSSVAESLVAPGVARNLCLLSGRYVETASNPFCVIHTPKLFQRNFPVPGRLITALDSSFVVIVQY